MTEDAKHYLQIKDGAVWGVHRGRCEIVVGADVCSTYGIHTFGAAVEFLKATRPHLQSVKFVQLEQGYPTPAAERGHGEHMTTPAMPELLREIVAYCREAGHDWSSLTEAEHHLAALQSQPAEVSDEDVWELWLRVCAESDNVSTRVMIANFARAILALRPQAESDARRAAQEQLYTERERHTAEFKRLQAEIGRLQSLRPQAVPMTDEQRQRVFAAAEHRTLAFDNVSWRDAIVDEVEAHHGITQRADGGEQQA